MTYFSTWPFIIIMAILLCIMSCPIFRGIKASVVKSDRVQTIEGLRGFLAYGVVFSHGQNFYTLLVTGQWAGSPNFFYNFIGTVAVRLFFMVTAYLFWSNLLSSKGKMEWSSFYIKRVCRIAPVYWSAFLCVFMIVMIESHWVLRVSWLTLSKQIFFWLTLGILPLPDINHHMMTFMILLGVVWTLQYEWLFYGILPIISWFARSKKRALVFIICGMIMISMMAPFMYAYPTISQILSVFFMFFLGMLCATLQQYSIKIPLNTTLQSIMVITIMGVVFLYVRDGVYISTILYALVFFFIISGCSVFGLLNLTASQRLGEVSYGVYLLQGIIFHLIYSVQFIRYYVLQGAIEFWSIMTLICSLILLFAICVHLLFEKPGIKLGYKLSYLLSSKRKSIINKL